MHAGGTILGHWYLIQAEGKTHLKGPAMTWQDACIQALGHIAETARIKCVGNNEYWIKRKGWVEAQANDEAGWFSPYVRGGFQGTTFRAEEAFGPPEIAAIMRKEAEAIRTAACVSTAREAWDRANEFLRWIPATASAKFSDLFNTTIARLKREEDSRAQQRLSDDGCPIQG